MQTDVKFKHKMRTQHISFSPRRPYCLQGCKWHTMQLNRYSTLCTTVRDDRIWRYINYGGTHRTIHCFQLRWKTDRGVLFVELVWLSRVASVSRRGRCAPVSVHRQRRECSKSVIFYFLFFNLCFVQGFQTFGY